MAQEEEIRNFPGWLNEEMRRQGRSFRWISTHLEISEFVVHYKRKTDTFTEAEENKIKELLK